MLRSLVGSEMCIRDRYQRRVRGPSSDSHWWRRALAPAGPSQAMMKTSNEASKSKAGKSAALQARIRREKELMKILGEKKQQRDISQEIALNNTESQKQCGAGCFNFIKNLNPWAARDEAAAMQQPLNTPSGDDYHYKGLL
eukprot:TRINITY_DN10218_c0_g1_i3.p1 TRINITY_DN10218_c0_g1~~TRINITY_DN10218_c0_g1_i3.p1  ORF type:complete len:141 (-),score=54.75 TRINITY_DN10218_c0_g1_i3:215-637(-)